METWPIDGLKVLNKFSTLYLPLDAGRDFPAFDAWITRVCRGIAKDRLSIPTAVKEWQEFKMAKEAQPAPAGKPGTGRRTAALRSRAGPEGLRAWRPEDGRRLHYERRRPEDTVLYQLVQEHLETLRPRRAKQALPWAWLSWLKSSLRPRRDCPILSKKSSMPSCNAAF
ncbi:MAG: hypothetical protein ACREXY_16520 [Gammaproteobacteria bacterium]